MIKKNDVVELEITDIGADGEGIGKYEGFTLFVKDAVVGDVVKAHVLKMKKAYGYAKVTEIVRPSEYRVEPKCEFASKCGGCQLQHLSYEKQLEYKQNKVVSCLERIGGFKGIAEVPGIVMPIIGMEEPFYYRNKAQFPVGRGKNDELLIGFYAGHTHSIINHEECAIQSKVCVDIVRVVRSWIEENSISIYNEETHTGLLRHILTRVGFATGEIMVCLIINGDYIPATAELTNALVPLRFEEKARRVTADGELIESEYHIKSICVNINKDKTNRILGDVVKAVLGEPRITDYIGDLKYRISPLSFFQVNPMQTKKLYDKALEYAGLNGDETVWDLYCGTGTISLFLAKAAKQVYGIEIIPQAVEDAKVNAGINNITNAEFFAGAAEEVFPLLYEKDRAKYQADVVVVDPPRKGCDEVLLDTIVKMGPKRVVYVSCDPATLARDLKYLCEKGYDIKKVQPVEQFAQTGHVECVVLMSKKG